MLRIFSLILTVWICLTSALPASNKTQPSSPKIPPRSGKAESLGGFLCGLGQMAVGGTLIATGLAFEIATVGGYTIGFALQTEAGLALMASGCAQAMYESRDISIPRFSSPNFPAFTKNTNPFDAPVVEDIIVVDEQGNSIKVPQGNWLTGSGDGNWIQEMEPSAKPEGRPTGTRKDGGHRPGPKHPDPRAWGPHGHVPGVTNPDGTPWLPIY